MVGAEGQTILVVTTLYVLLELALDISHATLRPAPQREQQTRSNIPGRVDTGVITISNTACRDLPEQRPGPSTGNLQLGAETSIGTAFLPTVRLRSAQTIEKHRFVVHESPVACHFLVRQPSHEALQVKSGRGSSSKTRRPPPHGSRMVGMPVKDAQGSMASRQEAADRQAIERDEDEGMR
jgi:hypothetical protein